MRLRFLEEVHSRALKTIIEFCSIVKFCRRQIISLAAADIYRRLEVRSAKEAISGGVRQDAENEPAARVR